jgi:hypothetical protein
MILQKELGRKKGGWNSPFGPPWGFDMVPHVPDIVEDATELPWRTPMKESSTVLSHDVPHIPVSWFCLALRKKWPNLSVGTEFGAQGASDHGDTIAEGISTIPLFLLISLIV